MRTSIRIGFSVLAQAIAVATLVACGSGSQSPPASVSATPTLSGAAPRIDPCDFLSPQTLASEELTVRKSKTYEPIIQYPQLKYSGCEIANGSESVGFYLEATNMTLEYLAARSKAQNNTAQDLQVDGKLAVLANSRDYPGQCMLLVKMSDYGLLFDGSFPNKSCDYAVELAKKLVPQLEGK